MLPTLSSLSVSKSPVGRLRHWCSSEYLRISPLHSEFRLPLLHSRTTVLDAAPQLSCGISHPTCCPACAPFTPSNSGQRLPPTYYRGCWHVVSRGFLLGYRHFLLHQRQRFTIRKPSSLTRRCCIRLSPIVQYPPLLPPVGVWAVSMWPFNLSVRLPIVDLVGRYPTNYLIGREPIFQRLSFDINAMRHQYVMRY